MTNIVLLGYGRMGHAIEAAMVERGLESPAIITDTQELERFDFQGNEVVIEFTRAPSCVENFRYLLNKDICVVSGTTGWLDQEREIQDLARKSKGAFLFAANFSIGVHIFWRLIEKASQIFDSQPRYDVFTHEVHHPHKVDSPSGTARHTADILLNNIARKTHLVSGDVEGPLDPSSLHVSASRGGFQAGEHTVTFDGPDDLINITHHAKGRAGFANGAIDCALWLEGRHGYFTINDYLEEILP